MNKMLYGAVTGALVALAGCTPNEEQIKLTAMSIGYTAGMVANETPIKDEDRNTVIEVLTEVRTCIPVEGQSFMDAWTPIINEKVEKLVDSGKVVETTGSIISSIALMAAKGIDYMFDVRYPEVKENAKLVAAGATCAIDGFLAAFKPVDCDSCSEDVTTKSAKIKCDEEAYKWLKNY